MAKPMARQQVFRLTENEQRQIERLVVNLNQQLEVQSSPSFTVVRETTRLLVLRDDPVRRDVVSDLILNEVASRFQDAGYLVEPIPATRGGATMLRIR